MAEHGLGCTMDIGRAEQFYRKASEKDNYARAQNYLGSIYYHGKGEIEVDYQEAVRWVSSFPHRYLYIFGFKTVESLN
jgi:TPR repeat protein